MTELKFYKLNAVPTVWEANAFYLIKSNYVDGTGNVEYAESFITNALAIPKAVGNATMIGGIVDKKIVDAISPSSFKIVATIAARNLLPVTASFLVLVLNATADTSVSSGAALYAYNLSTTSFSKVAEYESMDVSLTWASIQNKPSSAVADIDESVTNRMVADTTGGRTNHIKPVGVNKIHSDFLDGALTFWEGTPEW